MDLSRLEDSLLDTKYVVMGSDGEKSRHKEDTNVSHAPLPKEVNLHLFTF